MGHVWLGPSLTTQLVEKMIADFCRKWTPDAFLSLTIAFQLAVKVHLLFSIVTTSWQIFLDNWVSHCQIWYTQKNRQHFWTHKLAHMNVALLIFRIADESLSNNRYDVFLINCLLKIDVIVCWLIFFSLRLLIMYDD